MSTTQSIKFPSLESILDDPQCREFIRLKIISLSETRREMLEKSRATAQGKSPVRLRRSSYDVMKESGLLDPYKLVAEFGLIRKKLSGLASRERYFVLMIVSEATSKTIHFYTERERVEVDAKPIPGKQRKSKKQVTN